MSEFEAEAVWATIQEFIRGLQRQDPTVRRWIVPRSEAELLLDIYGEEGLLTLLKDYLGRERFVLLRIVARPEEKEPTCLVEIVWVKEGRSPPAAEDRVTLQVRRVRRTWQVEDIWPSPLDAPLTVDMARADWARREEMADPAAIFLAGAVMTPPEGCGELDDVETLFVLSMDAHGYSPREVVRAVRMWRDFRRTAQPTYRRPALFAAAVEYAFSLLGLYRGDSRARIAAYYGVTPDGLGRCFARLRRSLGLVFFDPRYCAFGPPPEEVQAQWRANGLPCPPPLRGRLDDLACRQQP